MKRQTALYWYCQNNGKEIPSGEFHFRSLDDIAKKTFVIWDDEMSEEEQEFLRSLIVFDIHPHTGDGVKSCLKKAQEGNRMEIWLIDSNGECFLTSMDQPAYINALLELKGWFGWQFLFCDIDLTDSYFRFVKNDLNRMINVLPQLFKEVDYEKYQTRFQQINT